MKTCKDCKYYNAEEFHCEKFECMAISYDSCPDYEGKPKKLTNGDRIRQMSDAELVATIEELSLRFTGKSEFIAWLKQEAKDE